MSHYRVIVHYHFRKGMEAQGIRFLEKELVDKARELGCVSIEIWQNEHDPSYSVGVGAWSSFEDARKFQGQWDAKEQELLRYCANAPKRTFFRVKNYTDKAA